MGQQFNKVIKRRRRADYLERKKTKGLELSAASKTKPRKPTAKKAE